MESRTARGQLSTLELTAWRGLLCTHAWLQRELDRKLLDAEALSLSSYEVLLRLAQAEGRRMRMRDIAGSLLISRSGLTGIVNELERRGYVARECTADDGRGIEAALTKTGLAALRKARRVHSRGRFRSRSPASLHRRHLKLGKRSQHRQVAIPGPLWRTLLVSPP